MKVLKIKDYFKEQDHIASYIDDYIKSLIKDTVFSEMVEFKDPDFLGGAFDGKYGLITIDNCLKTNYRLKSDAENFESWLRFSEGLYSFDSLIASNIEGEANYINVLYKKSTGEMIPKPTQWYDVKKVHHVFIENRDSRIKTLEHQYLKEDRCSKSNVSNSDLLKSLLTVLKENSKEAVIASIERTLINMEKRTEDFFDIKSDPSYERPFVLHVHGTDDFSWGIACATYNDAIHIRNIIVKEPTHETLNKYLDFTN